MPSSRASSGAVVSAPPAKRVKRSSSWAAASVLNAQKPVAICIRGTGVTGATGATSSLEWACPEYVPSLVAIAFAPFVRFAARGARVASGDGQLGPGRVRGALVDVDPRNLGSSGGRPATRAASARRGGSTRDHYSESSHDDRGL